MEIQKILSIIGGFLFLASAFLHLLFVLVYDTYGGLLYYWFMGDPSEIRGIEGIAIVGIGVVFALILSFIHAVFYFIMGAFLLGFKNNRIVPIFSAILAIVGIFLALRVIFIFGHVSNFLILLVVIDLIVLVINVYGFIALSV